jgi:hypothetical protein
MQAAYDLAAILAKLRGLREILIASRKRITILP